MEKYQSWVIHSTLKNASFSVYIPCPRGSNLKLQLGESTQCPPGAHSWNWSIPTLCSIPTDKGGAARVE